MACLNRYFSFVEIPCVECKRNWEHEDHTYKDWGPLKERQFTKAKVSFSNYLRGDFP